MRKFKEIQIFLEKMLCKLAVIFAPQISEYCMGFYYQPKEPDNIKELLAKKQNVYGENEQ